MESDKSRNDLTAIGKIAPAITQPDPTGKMISLADYKGKYVLVDFWASWCGPCRKENPHVLAAYDKFKDKGFTVLGISLDKESQKDAWLEAIKVDKLPWMQISDLKGFKSEAVQAYGINGIPANFLIGPDGKILAKNLRGHALEEALARILNK